MKILERALASARNYEAARRVIGAESEMRNLMLRVVEQMPVEETASALGILAQTVKSRLHRAKAMLRSDLEENLTAVSLTAFPFGGARCQRVTDAVLTRLSIKTTILHH